MMMGLAGAIEIPEPPQPELIYWGTPEAAKRLDRAAAKADFHLLANHQEAQANKFFCGPASAVMVLNALRGPGSPVKKPTDATLFSGDKKWFPAPDFNPLFERYTQLTFFNADTDLIKTLSATFGEPASSGDKSDYGLQLERDRQLHS